jgi:hypothetical protein
MAAKVWLRPKEVRRNATTGTYKFACGFLQKYDDRRGCMKSGSEIWLLPPNRRIEGAFGKRSVKSFLSAPFKRRAKRDATPRRISCLYPVAAHRAREKPGFRSSEAIMRQRGSPGVGLEEWFGSSFVPLKFQNLGEGVWR